MLLTQLRKTDYKAKISETENKVTADHDYDKYITTQEFNKLTSESFTAKLRQANLGNKIDITNFVKRTDFNKNELNKLSRSTSNINKRINKRFDK